jgi:hypothetical protein
MDSFDLYLSLQTNMYVDIIKEIFASDWRHYEMKWEFNCGLL